MNSRRIVLLAASFWVILVASTAMAGPMHTHAHHAGITDGANLHRHAPQAVSPFEAKPGDRRLHCELLGHNPLLPCPHLKNSAQEKDKYYLTNDCGGGPFQAPSFRSVGDFPRFLVSMASAVDDLQITTGQLSPTVLYDPFYFHSLDRPPRTL